MYTTINMLGMIRGHVDRMELLKKQDALVTETPDEKVNPAILVKNIVGTANVPIRATINAPEAYGGIRLLGIPGLRHGRMPCGPDRKRIQGGRYRNRRPCPQGFTGRPR